MSTHWSQAQSKTRGSEPAREDVGTFNINVPDTPLSRASPLPQGICGVWRILCMAEKPVGVSLLAKTSARSISLWLTHCFREQAHSYRGFVVVADFVYGRETCGSGLAREDGGTFNIT